MGEFNFYVQIHLIIPNKNLFTSTQYWKSQFRKSSLISIIYLFLFAGHVVIKLKFGIIMFFFFNIRTF